jgi:predicted phosphodiesterase
MHLDDKALEEIRLEHMTRGGGYNWVELVEKYKLNIPAEALRKRVSRYEKRVYSKTTPQIQKDFVRLAATNDETPEMMALRLQVKHLQDQLNKPKQEQEELLYEPYPEHLDDTYHWERWQEETAKKQQIITAGLLTDIHLPDENKDAIKLALKVCNEAEVDCIVLMGDNFDFDLLSTFATSRKRKMRDAIKEVDDKWHKLIDDIKENCPTCKTIVTFRGNHDSRIERWNDAHGNPFGDSLEENYVEMIRSKGRVLWLGDMQETYLGNLYIQHGKRVGENAAKSTLKDIGWSTPVVQGHNHRPAVYWHRVNKANVNEGYRVVTSASIGALCNNPPHYQTDSNMSAWINGMAIAHVNMLGEDVNIQNIVFHRNKQGFLWCGFGKEIITSL